MHNPASRFLVRAARRPGRLAPRGVGADPLDPPGPQPAVRRGGRARPTAAGRRNFSSAALRIDAAAKAKPARAIPSLDPGDRVLHPSMGMGTVVSLEGTGEKTDRVDRLRVRGGRRLLLRYAPVEKL